ncbi:response regulator transcription factor [Paenibacillus sp. SAF-054]|uniref:response regulator transcription factor n=1 Tax=unclassified Paenibacillus TaxID=185978 RepID=UPI003F7F4625
MKYKIVLVDDEKWVLKDMRLSVDWESYGYEVVGEAMNGILGLKVIQEQRPHLVITDVRMPGMDGLELIREVNRLELDTRFIVSSGHAEFEYAQQAINAGAIGYCLKPFEEQEMAGLLTRFRAMQQEKELLLQMELLYFMSDRIESKAYAAQLLHRMNLSWDNGQGMLVVAVIGENEEPPGVSVPLIRLRTGRQETMYLLRAGPDGSMDGELAASLLLAPAVKGIGCSRTLLDAGQLHCAYQEAEAASYQYFMTGLKGLYMPVAERSWPEIKDLWQQMGNPLNPEQVTKLCDMFGRFAARGTVDIQDALRFCNTFFLMHSGQADQDEYIHGYEQLVEKYGTLANMLKEIRLFSFSPQQVDLEADASVRHETLQDIMHYLDGHFTEDVSLKSISEQFYVNPSYLSQLFRKVAKTTFLQYVTDKRIAYACRLLGSSRLTIYEVSEQSGYPNYFYFAKVFKKNVGKTPTQYREETKGGCSI